MKLAILIASLPDRKELLDRLLKELTQQAGDLMGKEITIIVDAAPRPTTTGAKRNTLMDQAMVEGAQYIAFFDDDDMPGPTYISKMLEGIATGADCCSLVGQIYWNGKPGKPFLHSIKYQDWWEDENFYYRCPNHLNCIKLDLVKDIKFPDQVFGEDGQWSMKIKEAGVLKTEFEITDVIYKYFVGEPKFEIV